VNRALLPFPLRSLTSCRARSNTSPAPPCRTTTDSSPRARTATSPASPKVCSRLIRRCVSPYLQPRSRTPLRDIDVSLPARQAEFEKDFLTSKPNLREYVKRLQEWRDRYEKTLNSKAKRVNLEASSHWLVEFQYQKFDEIEVPGQYLQHEDNSNKFVRISHFSNRYDVHRGHGVFFRRLTILGQDGSVHQFMIQIPAARTSRREERIMQLFRMLNWCAFSLRAIRDLRTALTLSLLAARSRTARNRASGISNSPFPWLCRSLRACGSSKATLPSRRCRKSWRTTASRSVSAKRTPFSPTPSASARCTAKSRR
jgi:hypothetical protein